MNRRDFLRSASIVSAGLAFPETARLFAEETLSNGWRTFEVTTYVEVLKPSGATRIWLPVPLTSMTPFQRTLANKYTAEGGAVKLVESNATSSRVRRPGSRLPKSRARPISSAVPATSFKGLRARPATSHEAARAAMRVGTPEMTRKPTMPDRFDCTTRVDCPVTT